MQTSVILKGELEFCSNTAMFPLKSLTIYDKLLFEVSVSILVEAVEFLLITGMATNVTTTHSNTKQYDPIMNFLIVSPQISRLLRTLW